jgi:hypothetical protein
MGGSPFVSGLERYEKDALAGGRDYGRYPSHHYI